MQRESKIPTIKKSEEKLKGTEISRDGANGEQ